MRRPWRACSRRCSSIRRLPSVVGRLWLSRLGGPDTRFGRRTNEPFHFFLSGYVRWKMVFVSARGLFLLRAFIFWGGNCSFHSMCIACHFLLAWSVAVSLFSSLGERGIESKGCVYCARVCCARGACGGDTTMCECVYGSSYQGGQAGGRSSDVVCLFADWFGWCAGLFRFIFLLFSYPSVTLLV